MTELLLELLNIAVPYISAFAIKLYPMWKTRDVKTRAVVIYIACFALYMCAGFLVVKRFWAVDFRVMQMYKLCIELPVAVMSFWAFRKRIWQNIFLITTSALYVTLSIGTGTFVSGNYFHNAAYPLLAADIASLTVIVLTLPPLLFFLRRLCENPHMNQAGVWRIIWILPLTHFGMYLLAGSPFDVNNFKGGTFILSRILIYGVLLFTCYLLETALRQVSENISLKENARLIESRIEQQEEQFNLIAESTDMALAARHDLRHHLSTLRGLLDSGKLDELERYLSEYSVARAGDTGVSYCWNARVNALLCYYAAKAKELDADVRISIDLPRESGISDLDLSVVLGNCFDNAIAACADVPIEKRRISLKCTEVTGSLMILLDNSFNGKPPEKRDGRFLSSKHDGPGFGLASVMSVAEKYGGMAEFTVVGDEFRSEVELRMQSG